MRAHDILGVTVMADTAKIESAYSDKMDILHKNGFDKAQPVLYYKKAEELKKAREECMAYINAPFARKTQLEMKDCMDRMRSPNVTNSCCCGNSCESCCETTCCVILGAGGITLAGIIAYRLQKAMNRSKFEELRDRYIKEEKELEKLKNKKDETNAEIKEKEAEKKRLQEQLDIIQNNADILNNFIKDNGVSGDFMDSEACMKLKSEIHSLNEDIKAMEDEIENYKERGNTISQHYQEYLDFQNRSR